MTSQCRPVLDPGAGQMTGHGRQMEQHREPGLAFDWGGSGFFGHGIGDNPSLKDRSLQ
jgi:hypothetical protein